MFFSGTSAETRANCNRPRVTFENLPVLIEESHSEIDDREVSHPYEEIPLRQPSLPITTYEQIDENDSDDRIPDDNRPRVPPDKARERPKTLAIRDVDESNSDVPSGRSRRPPIRFGIDEYVTQSKRKPDFGRLSCERSRPSSISSPNANLFLFFLRSISHNVIIYKIKYDCFPIGPVSHK